MLFRSIVYDEKHFNSQITLFGKLDSCKRDSVFYLRTDFEKYRPVFLYDTSKFDTSHFHSGKRSLYIDPKSEFCIMVKSSAKNIFIENNCLNISTWIFPTDTFNAEMVMDVGDKTNHEWRSILLKPFVKSIGKWQEVFATFKLSASAFPDDEVKIYLWNPGKNSFYLDDFTISAFADSKYNYYEISYRK